MSRHWSLRKTWNNFATVLSLVGDEGALNFAGIDAAELNNVCRKLFLFSLQCVIDLKQNCLVVGDTRTPFLAEHEIPASCRQVQEEAGPSVQLNVDGSNFAEEDIRKVARCGFTDAQAIEALKYSRGDVKKAIAWLVVRNLDKP